MFILFAFVLFTYPNLGKFKKTKTFLIKVEFLSSYQNMIDVASFCQWPS